MKKFHITFYKQKVPSPILAGVTIEATDMWEALNIHVLSEKSDLSEIKYIIEL